MEKVILMDVFKEKDYSGMALDEFVQLNLIENLTLQQQNKKLVASVAAIGATSQ